MVLICDEIVHMIKSVMTGIKVTEETLALDVIKEVGYGGQFLDHDHTAEHFRGELFFPNLFKRQSVTQWRESGGRTILEVAHDRVQHIIAKAEPVALPQGADEALTNVFRWAIEELEGE
jgi:trimethylamine--corrinoid protein Co-methyltransferase